MKRNVRVCRVALSWWAVLWVLSWGAQASAEGDFLIPSDSQMQLYQEGAEAFKVGNYEKAVDLFKASLHLGELNITYLNLGRALFKLQRCEEAIEAYQKVKSAPAVETPGPDLIAAKLKEYEVDIPLLCPGTLVLECTPEESFEVRIDRDTAMPCSSQPIALPPGVHTVHARDLRTGARRFDLQAKVTVVALESVKMRFGGDKGGVREEKPSLQIKNVPWMKTRKDPFSLVLLARGGRFLSEGGTYSSEGVVFGERTSNTIAHNAKSSLLLNVTGLLVWRGMLAVGPSVWGRQVEFVTQEDRSNARQYLNLDANLRGEWRLSSGPGLAWYLAGEAGYATLRPEENSSAYTGYNVMAGVGGRFATQHVSFFFEMDYTYRSLSRLEEQENGQIDESLDGLGIMISLGAGWVVF